MQEKDAHSLSLTIMVGSLLYALRPPTGFKAYLGGFHYYCNPPQIKWFIISNDIKHLKYELFP